MALKVKNFRVFYCPADNHSEESSGTRKGHRFAITIIFRRPLVIRILNVTTLTLTAFILLGPLPNGK